MPSPKAAPLALTPEERAALLDLTTDAQHASNLALRASIVLACAGETADSAGTTIGEVAAALGLSRDTVSKWRRRFIGQRLAGLSDDPRPGRPRTISDEQVAQVIATTLSLQPPNGQAWSTRTLATATGLSQSAVSRIWRNHDRSPNVLRTWALSRHASTADLVAGVVGLFISPPHCMLALYAADEQNPPASGSRQGRGLPRRSTSPTTPIRYATRRLISSLGESRQHAGLDPALPGQECRRFLRGVNRNLPEDVVPHLVCADAATFRLPEVKTWLLRHPRFQLHVTPTSGSWFAVVERWHAELASRTPSPTTSRDMVDLELAVRGWLSARAERTPAFLHTRSLRRLRTARRMHQRWLYGES